MAGRSSIQRRPGGTARFGAPLGRSVKLITGASLLLLVTLMVVPPIVLRHEPGPMWARLLAPALVALAFGILFLFSVRGYSVKGRELLVQRPLWETRFSLRDLEDARVDPAAMARAWRTMGNGGLLVFAGWFRNKRLGKFRALVTDQQRCVVLEFKREKLVVSPDDPQGFVEALGFGSTRRTETH